MHTSLFYSVSLRQIPVNATQRAFKLLLRPTLMDNLPVDLHEGMEGNELNSWAKPTLALATYFTFTQTVLMRRELS